MYAEMTRTDFELLTEYTDRKSEAAFALLVSRHVDMVYSVALRAVRDPHLAEDVTQAAFIILSRKANSLGANTILSSWLCRTARYAAANALTEQRRRLRREHEAPMRSVSSEPESDPWAEIAPLLEGAMAHLGEKDHHAIVLRFFERKDLKQVGSAMGIAEDAARMRVNRALEKMRKFFRRRGVGPATAVIAGVMTSQSVQAAPAGLTASVTAAAVNGSSGAASASALVHGTLKLMTWAKLKVAVVISSIMLATGAASMVAIAATREAKDVLPANVRAELDKQKAALQTVYFEFTETTRGTIKTYNHAIVPYYFGYFDRNRFYQRKKDAERDDEVAFDGKTEWVGTSHDITKQLHADHSQLERSYRWRNWPYLEAASIYAPAYIAEEEQFASLEPMLLRDLKRSEATKVEAVGENLRVTVRVEDHVLAALGRIDLAEYQRDLESRPNTKQYIADEIAETKRLRALKPTRTIAFLLDARHGYQVAEREEWTAAGEHIGRIQSDGWKFYQGPGIWLPSRCVATYYTHPWRLDEFSDQPVHISTHELKRVEFGKKDIPFALDPNRPVVIARPTAASKP
jgi:RNA polymerase sigma factor (sigma-70 family)